MSDLRRTMRTKRSKFEAIGWYYMMKFFLFLLRYPLNYQPTGVATYYHSVLSLVPGPKERFSFGILDSDDNEDVRVNSLVYFVPGLGRVTCGISAITNGDRVSIGLMCD